MRICHCCGIVASFLSAEMHLLLFCEIFNTLIYYHNYSGLFFVSFLT